ncbi:MAG: hypothetical protein ACK4HW_00890 [Roseinatronobacter sp.]
MTQTLPAIALAALLTLGAQTADARGEGRALLPSFDQLDPTESGAITRADLQNYMQGSMTARHDQFIAKLMEQADADGKLDADALRKGLEAMHADRRAALDQSGRRGGAHRGNHDATEMGARLFERMDTNKDGKVDAAEYAAFTERMSEQRGRRGWGWRN